MSRRGAAGVRKASGARRVARGLVGLLLVALVVLGLVWFGVGPFPDREGCTATAAGESVDVDLEQAQNAAVIAGIAVERGLPARAVSIALATAYQESDIRNLDHGDRDSLGIFQQRPSQGWGSARQVRDIYHSANRFYDALEKVRGYRSMRVTEAAQEVQRSAFGNAYADHEDDARVLASTLTGYSQAAFTCVVRHEDRDPQEMRRNGLTRRANVALRDLERTFGPLPVGGFQPGGVTTGHIEGSAHYEGRAVDVFFRPAGPANQRRGWAAAHYLVARADQLGIETVIYDDRIWSAGIRSEAGWREYDEPSGPNQPVLEHRDHVHAEVVDDAA
ncbi:MAG: hypothetical protein M3211_02140 [Actinomycetota bacterium]|nr:hypothetical protein [Actinomycetota bacterium]